MVETGTVREGDCLGMLRTAPDREIDACVTDPPYNLHFMGQEWDRGGLADGTELWKEVLRVLKPGAWLVAFGATRTYHRTACAIEDAGFGVKDALCWHHGTGFPKSHNDAGGLGTALKPATELMVLAQKPREGTYVQNHRKHGTGFLNIDEARIPLGGDWVPAFERVSGTFNPKPGMDDLVQKNVGHRGDVGRWPANIVHDGSEDVLNEFPQSGGNGNTTRVLKRNRVAVAGELGLTRKAPTTGTLHGDGAGSAARFFYCAKPHHREKEAGLDDFRLVESHEINGRAADSAGNNNPRAGIRRSRPRRNTHTTVKPIELMRWLVRLVTPKGGVVLDPFLGSGTTAIAAVLEERRWTGMEREKDYAALARARIAWWTAQHASGPPGRTVADILGGSKTTPTTSVHQSTLFDVQGLT